MDGREKIEKYLLQMICTSKLPAELFDKDSSTIHRATEDFVADYLRWYPNDTRFDYYKLLVTPQLGAILCYRISHIINKLQGGVNTFGTAAYKPGPYSADAYSLLGREIGQIEIFYSSTIGPGLKINHGGGTVIGARCSIGANCTIHQNCTLGDKNGGRPKIGNNVTIYAGSMILGDITIGDNSIIGANSVVMESCPANSILVGSPAKIIKV